MVEGRVEGLSMTGSGLGWVEDSSETLVLDTILPDLCDTILPDLCVWGDWILTQGCQDPEVHSQALCIALCLKLCSDLSETRRKRRKRSSKTTWEKGNLH